MGWARFVNSEATFKHRPTPRLSYGRTSIIEAWWCFKCSNHNSIIFMAYLHPSCIFRIPLNAKTWQKLYNIFSRFDQQVYQKMCRVFPCPWKTFGIHYRLICSFDKQQWIHFQFLIFVLLVLDCQKKPILLTHLWAQGSWLFPHRIEASLGSLNTIKHSRIWFLWFLVKKNCLKLITSVVKL